MPQAYHSSIRNRGFPFPCTVNGIALICDGKHLSEPWVKTWAFAGDKDSGSDCTKSAV